MAPNCTYRIVEASHRQGGAPVYEVWGTNAATGYQWLIAEYDTRDKARVMIRHWQEAKA